MTGQNFFLFAQNIIDRLFMSLGESLICLCWVIADIGLRVFFFHHTIRVFDSSWDLCNVLGIPQLHIWFGFYLHFGWDPKIVHGRFIHGSYEAERGSYPLISSHLLTHMVETWKIFIKVLKIWNVLCFRVDLYWFLASIFLSSCKHQIISQTIPVPTSPLSITPLQLFDSISIPQSVKSMLTGSKGRTNISYHDCLAVSYKGVFKNEGQLRSTERNMVFALVQSTNALLKGQKWLIYFCSIDSSLLITSWDISSSLTSSKINKTHFSLGFESLLISKDNSEHSMRSWGGIIGSSLAGDSHWRPIVDQTHNWVDIGDNGLSQLHDVDLSSAVLPYWTSMSVIQKVVSLPAVNFEEGETDIHMIEAELLDLSKDVHSSKQVKARDGVRAVAVAHHSEGFTRTGLTIGKAGNLNALEGGWDERIDNRFVNLGWGKGLLLDWRRTLRKLHRTCTCVPQYRQRGPPFF